MKIKVLDPQKYKVVRDRQGGDFGMGVEYTEDEWLQCAREWCESDDNTDLDNALERLQKEGYKKGEVIALIDEIWGVDFEPCK